jgi:hypothetical protein
MNKNLQNKGWDQMSGLLNQHMPMSASSGWGKSLIVLLFIFTVLGSGVYGYLYVKGDIMKEQQQDATIIAEQDGTVRMEIQNHPNQQDADAKATEETDLKAAGSVPSHKEDLSVRGDIAAKNKSKAREKIIPVGFNQSGDFLEIVKTDPVEIALEGDSETNPISDELEEQSAGHITGDDIYVPEFLAKLQMISPYVEEDQTTLNIDFNANKIAQKRRSFVTGFVFGGHDLYQSGGMTYGAGLQLKLVSRSKFEFSGEFGLVYRELNGRGSSVLKDAFRSSFSVPDSPISPIANSQNVANISLSNASFVNYGLGVNYRLRKGVYLKSVLILQHLLNLNYPDIMQSDQLANGEPAQEQLLRYEITDRYRLNNNFDILPMIGIDFRFSRMALGLEYRHSLNDLVTNSNLEHGLGQRLLSLRLGYTF